jgi:hypothetical protein
MSRASARRRARGGNREESEMGSEREERQRSDLKSQGLVIDMESPATREKERSRGLDTRERKRKGDLIIPSTPPEKKQEVL